LCKYLVHKIYKAYLLYFDFGFFKSPVVFVRSFDLMTGLYSSFVSLQLTQL
jgi:hypothetical protein